MKTKNILLIILLTCTSLYSEAQVTIGMGSSPMAGALLQLKEDEGATHNSTRGLGMPRVQLTDVGNLYPMFEVAAGTGVADYRYNTPQKKKDEDEKHIGLIVFHVNDLLLDGQGLYVWDGSKWQKLANDASGSTGKGRITLSQSMKRLTTTGNFNNYTLTATINSPQAETIDWSSSNTSIATVDATGKVVAKAAGTATMKATYGDGSHFAECTVVVNAPSPNSYKYRLTLKDKGDYSGHTTANPLGFLNQRSIDRRTKQNIAIDATDLPISQGYLQLIEKAGGIVVAKSKWLNTVTVHCSEAFLKDDIEALPFVASAKLVWRGAKDTRSLPSPPQPAREKRAGGQLAADTGNSLFGSPRSLINYGKADINIAMNMGKSLHDDGYQGEGMEIAVIDDGFGKINTDTKYFGSLNIAGTKSFVYKQPKVFDMAYWHGPEVISCLAANNPGDYVGTAPNARYWLLRSEDLTSEYPVEEDYWVTAVEYADSVGVDLINSSVGYGKAFTDPSMNYTYNDTDGKTIHMSRGATMAAHKGILVVSSAGNDGGWIDAPGEAIDVLTVGGVYSNGTTLYGSRGLTHDGRSKPDALAMGGGVPVIDVDGVAATWNGTSFSSPILCGLAACLWQAYPQLTSLELLEIIKSSADRPIGTYKIANMAKAREMIEGKLAQSSVGLDKSTIQFKIGEETIITPTFSGGMPSASYFEWSTDRPDIVSIRENSDKSLSIIALREGVASVKIESKDGLKSAVCNITADREGDGIVRILAIGNSFTNNSMNKTLYDMAKANGKKVVIAKLTTGGLRFHQHLDYAKNNTAGYTYWKIDENGTQTNLGAQTMGNIIASEKWDYISLQQQSELAYRYDTTAKYLAPLLQYIESKSTTTKTAYALHSNWAYDSKYKIEWTDYQDYFQRDQMKMYKGLVQNDDSLSILVKPRLITVPFGTTIQNGRSSSLGADYFCPVNDGYHLNGVGEFFAACTWYELVFGDIMNSAYAKPAWLSDKDFNIAKTAAHCALRKPDEVTDMPGY